LGRAGSNRTPHADTAIRTLTQVVRYSALVGGIAYGFYHRRTLQAKFDSQAAKAEIEKREKWLQQAKQAWADKMKKQDGGASHASTLLLPSKAR